MEVIEGKITGYDEQGRLTVAASYDNPDRFIRRRYETVLIGLQDGRTITPEQRKKAYALINEIADYFGELPELFKKRTKLEYTLDNIKKLAGKVFSLADCDVTTAREYITLLIEIALEYGVPTKVPLYEYCDDIEDYVYQCLKHKKCSVCGRKGELHHVDRVGMGRDRTDICHEGMEAMCLCREHHTEAHSMSDREFFAKYHFDGGVKLNKELCRVYKLKARADA